MVRNRLSELQSASKHAPITEAEEMKPLNKAAKKKSSEDQVMDDFLSAMEANASNIEKVRSNADKLATLQRQILSSTHKDESKEGLAAELIENNKRLAANISSALKREQESVDNVASSPKKMTDAEKLNLRLRKTQVQGQSRRFLQVWTEYNNSQVEFRDKSKKLFVKRCKITNNQFTDEQIETMLDEGNTEIFAKSILDQERLAKQQLNELQDRHDEFLKLEKSIQEMRDMFVELGTLVQEQGEVLDNVMGHIEAAQQDVERGKGHLSSAEKHQRSARKKKIICFILLAVILLIVVLVILIEFGAFS